MSSWNKRSIAVGGLMFVAAHTATAEDQNLLNDKYSIDLGTYFMDSRTTIRADQIDGIGIGTALNLEDQFGLSDEAVFRLEGKWRFAKRHKLRLMYFDSSRSSSEHFSEEVDFADTTFPVNLEIG